MSKREPIAWITVNGAHVPIYDTSWMSPEQRNHYSKYVNDRSHDDQLDSDEKTWVEALRRENDQDKKDQQIANNKKQADQLNAEEQRIKPWSKGEEKRSKEMSKFVMDHLRAGDEFGEFYEENAVEEYDPILLRYPGFEDDEVSISKMNLVYAQNYDENEMRVKKGKAIPGSTYYVVQTEDGAIDETNFAYKTKADAEHAMQLYIQQLNKWRNKK